ncbi:MAG: lytic transglycosylase domain-containing protein [Vicinamibacteria bacterium]
MWNAKLEPLELERFSRKEGETPRIQPAERRRPAHRSAPPERRPPRRSSAWQSTALFSLCLLLVGALGLAYRSYQRASHLAREVATIRGQMQAGLQELRAGIEFDSVRRRLLLGVRDEILRVNGRLGLGEAFHYAELLLNTTDKYPSVDPLLLLSIGIVESRFDARARSHANARGLYQIWPATGRMLAGMLDWEYDDEMLYESDRNTEMAALYLDVLFTTYNDLGMVLAEYNGGPINAGYYRAGSHRTTPETADYVPKVLEHYQRLCQELPMAPGRSFDLLYRDTQREGKVLVPAKAD